MYNCLKWVLLLSPFPLRVLLLRTLVGGTHHVTRIRNEDHGRCETRFSVLDAMTCRCASGPTPIGCRYWTKVYPASAIFHVVETYVRTEARAEHYRPTPPPARKSAALCVPLFASAR